MTKSRPRCVCGRLATVLIGSLRYCARHGKQIRKSRRIARAIVTSGRSR